MSKSTLYHEGRYAKAYLNIKKGFRGWREVWNFWTPCMMQFYKKSRSLYALTVPFVSKGSFVLFTRSITNMIWSPKTGFLGRGTSKIGGAHYSGWQTITNPTLIGCIGQKLTKPSEITNLSSRECTSHDGLWVVLSFFLKYINISTHFQ